MQRDRSRRMFGEACHLIPGGVNSPVRAFRAVGGEPLFMEHGNGPHVWDVDGNRFVDCIGSWGPLLLGHLHPAVLSAVESQVRRAFTFGAPTEAETELAKRIVALVPSVEMVRLVSSGTEAAMSALRVARGFTGRNSIVKFEGCYHGHADFLLAHAGSGVATLGLPDCAGVPAATVADTITVPFNDADAVRRVFAARGRDVAAVVVEPVAGNMGCVPPESGFLEALRDVTNQNGALLVFDEVMTGFRVAPGGAQERYGVLPDLTVLGKVVGGGMPLAAYGGRADVMASVAPLGPVYQAGTLSGNPVAVAAGTATLDALSADRTRYARLEEAANGLAASLRDGARRAGVGATVNNVASMVTVFFTAAPVTDYASAKRSDTGRFSRWFNAMMEAGVYWPPSQFEAAFLSMAMTEADFEQIAAAACEAFVRAAA